ncbi:type IV pilus biogenesis/stability protein PilW [Vibrio sp. SCSIO 43137]|uniref:type IV pilus biogenesis/stability protein PilW n=1 Tax=Vibrio sp. SCSIO 43137 TaxID=3021011 RepID=UPI0023079BAD|nr:type IV pilus biogenesis/stability protein PilW [Vibrio sp. SCSIO 43137]WCE30298.1 type IV pilus biogenesis/stability protein PilW [Vibrio sp. SCSIO 43137]
MNIRVILGCAAALLSACVSSPELESNDIRAADARISLGLNYLFRENWLKARENLEIALKYAPNYYRSLNSIAYYYQLVGENELAEKHYKKALRQSPSNGDVLNNYGVFLCKLGNYKQADELFNRAIKQPDYYQVAKSYQNAAFCSLKSDDKEQAAYYFKRSLDYQPHQILVMYKLARLEFEMGQLAEAKDRLIKIHSKFGYQKQSLMLLIEIAGQLNRSAMAEKYSAILERLYPGSTQD